LIFHAIFWSNSLTWGSKYQSNVIKCSIAGHINLWWKAWKSFVPVLNMCSSSGYKMVLNSSGDGVDQIPEGGETKIHQICI
jgi:hypothetical protein